METKKSEIMVVEDSLTQAEVLKYILENNNYSVRHATDGQKALEILSRFEPDIIITDIVMPGLDGYQFCSIVKADDHLKKIPVILLTALSDPGEVMKGLECGADSFLVKPYTEEILISRIQYFIQNSELRKNQPDDSALEILFADQKFNINSSRRQIMDVLLSTYEHAVLKNKELIESNKNLQIARDNLTKLNVGLEHQVEFRTRELQNSNENLLNDIAGRKLVEEALRQSEEKFRNIFENNSAAIAIIEPDTTISMVNDAYCHISGYTAAEVVGMSWTQLIPPGDLERLKECNRRRLINPKDAPDNYEFTFYKKGGGVRHALMSLSMIDSNREIVASFFDITGRKQEEASLKELVKELRRMATVVKDSNDAVILHDFEGKILAWNRGAIETYGYTEAEALGNNVSDMVAESDREAALDLITRIRQEGIVRSLELRRVTRDGRILDVWLTATLLTDEEGNPLAIATSERDITGRLMAEKELKNSEQAYRLLVQHLHSGVVVHRPGSEVLLANERASVLLGLTIDQMMGKTAIDPAWCFVHADGTPLPVDEYPVERVLATKTSIQDTMIGINRPVTNDRVWVLANAFPEFDTDGQLSQVVVTFVDITIRNNIENKLFQSELKYRKLHESMMDGFIQVTMDGHITDCNESFQKMLGYSCAELSKLTYLDLTPEKWQNTEKQIVSEQVLPNRYSLVYEKEYRKKDGTIFPVELRTFLLKNENGENEGMWAIVRDITERKQTETGLIQIKNELEISVMAKTKELQERVAELERFHEATINRELRMKELNDEIEQLKRKL